MEVAGLTPLTKDVYSMTLKGECSDIERPGRFINITVPGFYLRRPISISSWNEKELTIVFRVVGGGTAELLSRSVSLMEASGLHTQYTKEEVEDGVKVTIHIRKNSG